MNEWVLVGVIVVGSIIALGGGGWIMRILTRTPGKTSEPAAKKPETKA